jgi:hypothetical protein
VIAVQQSFTCPECSQEYPSQAALNDHMQTEHGTIQTDEPQERQDPAESTEFPSDESVEQEEPEPAVPER